MLRVAPCVMHHALSPTYIATLQRITFLSFCVLCALRTSARTIHKGATVILRLLLVAGLACGWSAQHCALRWLLLFRFEPDQQTLVNRVAR